MSWDFNYRGLDAGEIIARTDEILKDDGVKVFWEVVGDSPTAGTPAPDHAYTSHRMYRRRRASEVPGNVLASMRQVYNLTAESDGMLRAELSFAAGYLLGEGKGGASGAVLRALHTMFPKTVETLNFG